MAITTDGTPNTTVTVDGVIVPKGKTNGGGTGTGNPGSNTPVPGGSNGLTPQQNSAAAYIRDLLRQYGLESLASWAIDELKKGYDDTLVIQHLREQPAFQERFKVIFDRQKEGLPALSPAQVIEYERTASQLMGQFGMPRGFYDSYSDFHDLLMRDVSPAELQSRLQNGYAQVKNGPQEVRDAFRDFYGANGDAALAAFFLDPEKAQPVLEQQLATAQNAGSGRRFGFDLNEEQARKLAEIGIAGGAQADKGFGDLNMQRGLFDENFYDQGDLSVGKEGVGAQFGLDATSQQKVDQRQRERNAAFAGGGGALRTNDGVRGAGVADQ